ncbi:prepilin-type N-terminal cleavage/methylation domain-containing protein [bacterium]|nr:prepilin-type N-terminal cleavage/methylation domain-containing protein [bacterium]
MIRQTRYRAFTLIELLIVVAIVAILSAATLALFLSPLREHVRVTHLTEMEAELGFALATLTADAHASSSVDDDGQYIRFRRMAGDNDAVYTRDKDGAMRRFLWPRANDDLPVASPDPGITIARRLTASDVTVNSAERTVSFRMVTEADVLSESLRREAIWTATLAPSREEVAP